MANVPDLSTLRQLRCDAERSMEPIRDQLEPSGYTALVRERMRALAADLDIEIDEICLSFMFPAAFHPQLAPGNLHVVDRDDLRELLSEFPGQSAHVFVSCPVHDVLELFEKEFDASTIYSIHVLPSDPHARDLAGLLDGIPVFAAADEDQARARIERLLRDPVAEVMSALNGDVVLERFLGGSPS